MIHDIKINLHAKTGKIIRGNINYTMIHKKYIYTLEIRYSLVTIYKDLLGSPKKNIYVGSKKKHPYVNAR